MYLCSSCSEAYFISDEARSRHYAICIAVHSFARTPIQTEAFDLNLRKRNATSEGPPVKKCVNNENYCKKCVNVTEPTTINDITTSDMSRAGPSTAVNAPNDPATPPLLRWELKKKGLKSARDYAIRNPDYYFDNSLFLVNAMSTVREVLRNELQETATLRYNITLESIYSHPDESKKRLNFKSRSRIIHTGITDDELQEYVTADYNKILTEESEYQHKNSGWSLDAPAIINIHVSRFLYNNATGSKYIELPKKIKTRRATVNVYNENEQCFKYAVLTKHVPHVRPTLRLTEHSFLDLEHVYNFQGLDFPVQIKQIPKFERLNPGTSVNIFSCDPQGLITPCRVVSEELPDHIDLLLYTNRDGDMHYIYITDFSKLIRPQLLKSRHNITVCKRCYSFVEMRYCNTTAEAWLQEHTSFCVRHKITPIKLPEEGKNFLKFKQYETKIPVPIVVVADFESTLVPVARTDNAYQEHVPNSFCTLIKSTLPEQLLNDVGLSTSPHLHRSENAGKEFMHYMHDLAQRVEILYTRQTPMTQMTADEIDYHTRAEVCDLCKQRFNATVVFKTLDHCHITGKYRHTLCSSCNLRARWLSFIPIYFHNLTNYDQAFIVRNLTVFQGCKVNIVPSNNEKFISISIKVGRIWLRFLDSYRLMAASLAELAGNLVDAQLIESSKLVPTDSIDLIRRKGVYCYDYVKNQQVFEETALPPKEAFFNSLNDEPVDPEDYKRAQTLWTRLKMKTFGDFHDFYLRLDVCLLMDVLMAFRKTCMETYQLDCCHHYTIPGFAFRAMLHFTGITLELLTDSDQLLMIESAMRGGLVQCNVRHARANNPTLECSEDYRSDEDTTYLFYLDCTNLYGHAMSMPLPTGNFNWVDPEGLDWLNLAVDSPHGLILECDVEYPETIHDRLQELPPLPQQSVPPGGKSRKLMATLINKERYVAHYTVFQQADSLGLKVTKVWRALSFSQSNWMKPFISLNADLRARSSVKFDRETYKLSVNSCFGKSMENVRKRVNVKVCTTDEEYQKLIRSPMYEAHTIVSENVILVQMRRKSVVMDKPVYLGMTVLDISKVYMYDFYYNVLGKHFLPNEIELNYTDTDSLLISIKTERDVYAILKEPTLSRHLDRSVFPSDHPLWSDENKGRLGTFKDEAKGRTIQEYVGLKAKMYTYRFNTRDENASISKAKGIKSAYVKQQLKFNHYKEALLGNVPPVAKFNLIRTKNFQLYSMNVSKKSLSPEDDKRHILECNIKTLPFGHYKLRQIDALEESTDVDSD